MKRLFIGGIQNGKMIDVEPYMDRIIIPVWKNQDSITPGTMGSAETKEEHYLRVDIHTHSEAFHLFIEKDLSIRDAFQMLIDKYADKYEYNMTEEKHLTTEEKNIKCRSNGLNLKYQD